MNLIFQIIGVIQIKNSSTAQNIQSTLTKLLEDFNIDIYSDVNHFTTDGCNTMLSIGKSLFPIIQQLCLAHCLHLVVTDCLYEKKSKKSNSKDQLCQENILPDDLLSALDNESDHSESDVQSEAGSIIEDDEIFTDGHTDDSEIENHDAECDLNDLNTCSNEMQNSDEVDKHLSFIYEDQLKLIRKTISEFKYSTNSNEILQKYVNQTHGKSLELFLDVKTRWSSVYLMVKRFLLLKDEIEKAIIDLKRLNKKDYSFMDNINYNLLKELVEALEIIKIASDNLCKKEATIDHAIVIFEEINKSLEEINSTTSQRLQRSLNIRQSERFMIHFTVYKFLNYNLSLKKNEESPVIEFIRTYYYNFNKNDQDNSNDESDTDDNLNEIDKLSFEDRIKRRLNEKNKMKKNIGEGKDLVKQEVRHFKSTGNLGKILRYVNDSIKTIKPTSVECERIFSNANFIFNKYRKRLHPKTLNIILFLRNYFQRS